MESSQKSSQKKRESPATEASPKIAKTNASRRELGIALALIAGVFAGVSTVLQKYGLGDDFAFNGATVLALATNVWFVIGIALIIFSWALFIVALGYGKASVLFTLMGGTTYIVLEALSILILDEHPSMYVWLGVAVIVVGVSLLGARTRSEGEGAMPQKRIENE